MERKIFDPKDWLNMEKPVEQAPKEVSSSYSSPTIVNGVTSAAIDISEIESIVQCIEERKLDITASYTEWRNIGFALASGLGEGGRDYFHRVSCFHPKYSKQACDQQYDNCLKGKRSGISMKSFFYYAKEAGVEINRQLAMGNNQLAIGNGQLAKGNGELSMVNRELGRNNGQFEIDNGEVEDNKQLAMGNRQGGAENRQLAIGNGQAGDNEQGEDNRQLAIDNKQGGRDEGKDGGLGRGVGVGMEEDEWGAPTLPAGIYDELPQFLKKVVVYAGSNEERDLLLLGSLAALSSCLPMFYGIYDGKKVYANLYLFITARASAGKGRLVHCKQLVQPIHYHLREQTKLLKKEYDILLAEYNQLKNSDGGEKPNRPPEKMLFIPANSSTTGVFQLLHENEGRGIIFETEGDTLAQAFKSDYGNYSDGFRKAFHHETISYYRRTDREYVDIESPCISTILSGTPKQVSALIPSAENGLFSRFIFYYMNIQPVWKDVFSFNADESLDVYFNQLGEEFFELYKQLLEQGDIQFVLTAEQQAQFNEFFALVQDTYVSLKGIDYLATVRRLGLIAFRFSMIFSALRLLDNGQLSMVNGELSMGNRQVVCEERDFQIALRMTRVLVKHAAKVFSELPEEEQLPKRNNRKERFFELLPKAFSRKDFLAIGRHHAIPDKTAERYILEFCKIGMVRNDDRGQYSKTITSELPI